MEETSYHQNLAVERNHWWFSARRSIIVGLVHELLPRGGRLLDVGCGTGYFLEGLPSNVEAWGLDFSPLAVRMCHERGLSHVCQGTTDDLSALAGRTHDLVCFLDVLEHLDDDVGALRAIKPILASGGRVLLTVPAYQWMWSRHDSLAHHRRRYTRSQIVDLLSRAGFETEYATYFNCRLFPLAWLVRKWSCLIGTETGEMETPSPFLNALLMWVFLGEQGRIVRRGSYPFGLSILAVAKVA